MCVEIVRDRMTSAQNEVEDSTPPPPPPRDSLEGATVNGRGGKREKPWEREAVNSLFNVSYFQLFYTFPEYAFDRFFLAKFR